MLDQLCIPDCGLYYLKFTIFNFTNTVLFFSFKFLIFILAPINKCYIYFCSVYIAEAQKLIYMVPLEHCGGAFFHSFIYFFMFLFKKLINLF